MLSRKTKSIYRGSPKLLRTENNCYAQIGKCDRCGGKKFTSVSKSDVQNGNGLLSMLGSKTPLAKILILGDLIF